VYRLLVGNQRESYLLEDTYVDRMIVLIRILKQWDVGVWTTSTWLGIGIVQGTCYCGNEPSGYINCGEFLD
jgi:hypothetical protein